MRAMIHRGWIATILLAAIAGCQAQSPTTVDDITEVQSALSATISIPVPIGLNPSDVGIGAIGQLYVNDRAQVREQADSTILAQIANVGFATGSTTNIGVTSQVGTINSVPRVTLRRGAFVSGSVYEGPAGGPIVQGPFTVTGFTASNAIPAMIADGNWKQTVTWPFNVNASVSLEPGQTPTLVQLAPAAYHDVSVKSGRTLQLRAGTYYFDSLFIDVSGGLQIDGSAGPVYVFVNGPVTFRGNMNGSTATPGLPIASLTIMTTGSASIGSSFQSIMFNGVVIASGSIGITGLVRGAFFGTNVTLF